MPIDPSGYAVYTAPDSSFKGLLLSTPEEEEEMSERIIPAREGFTFGCDPELFVFDANGKPVPADMIPGTKAVPHKVEFGAVQQDGFAAEFNIDPVSDFKTWNRNIDAVLRQLREMLPPDYTLRALPSVVFDKDVFDAASDDTKELGCHPDHNAWTGRVNPPTNTSSNPYMRTAAGHIHLGWTTGATMNDAEHLMNCRDLVKQLDWYLGGWSLRLDGDTVRRSLYGKAGACRFKDYGVEYRVLSNFWVESEHRRKTVWNRMQQAIHDMQQRFVPDKSSGYNQLLINSINTGTRDKGLESEMRYPLVMLG